MATVRTIKVGGNEYMFVCLWRKNRSGFVHEVELQKNGVVVSKNKVQYYNRTWECYSYQSAMFGCVSEIRDERKDLIKEKYLSDNGFKRLTADRKIALDAIFKDDKELCELEELRHNVDKGYEMYGWY